SCNELIIKEILLFYKDNPKDTDNASMTSSAVSTRINLDKSSSTIISCCKNSDENQCIKGCQNGRSTNITGFNAIFFVCIKVIASINSSKVPKPPGTQI